MEWTDVLIPVGIFAALGVLFGIILAVASRIFAVKTDERVAAVQENLPGANCGGCGYSGCAALAEAIVKGEALPTACRACSDVGLAAICEIMGMEGMKNEPMRARVMCSGNCHTAKYKYRYEGASDCIAAEKLGGGDKECPNGCVGLGTCVAACKFDAISIEDGVAVVDPTRCTGCGACASVCPKKLIAVVPVTGNYIVACHSVQPGAVTRRQCDVGCIACRICEKNCPAGAVTVTDCVAHIDQSKCIGCGKCAEKCPRKIIKRLE